MKFSSLTVSLILMALLRPPRPVENASYLLKFSNATEILNNLLSDYNRDERPNQKGKSNRNFSKFTILN